MICGLGGGGELGVVHLLRRLPRRLAHRWVAVLLVRMGMALGSDFFFSIWILLSSRSKFHLLPDLDFVVFPIRFHLLPDLDFAFLISVKTNIC
jgi:hypothetical protein